MIDKAMEALNEADSARAEELYMSLIIALEGVHDSDQKEIAQSLQKVSKELEGMGRQEAAFRFKQRTCEMMMRRSMELRMGKGPPRAQPSGQSAPAAAVVVAPELLQRCKEAVLEPDQERAELLYTDLIHSLEVIHDKNQRDVAQALKDLSKAMETSGMPDESFRFKQRTCEIMLKMSMRGRRRGI